MSTDDTNRDDLSNLKPKKEKVIQPIGGNTPPVVSSSAPNIPGASDDLLAELREKTARLAEQVQGKDEPVKEVLKIQDDSVSDKDVIEALKQNRPDTPLNTSSEKPKDTTNPAVELVREKLAKLYKREPDAGEEALEVSQVKHHRSKHQQFMYELTTSGKSLADIQTEWHNYYVELPDDEKHDVWREFYELQGQTSRFATAQTKKEPTGQKAKRTGEKQPSRKPSPARVPLDPRSISDIKNQLFDKISAGGQLTAVHHFKSLLFGLGLATLVGLIITFTFFNEVFIAPFISPAKTISATPIIGNQPGEVGPDPKIIIPKINLEVPVVYDLNTVEEKAVQKALEDGVVHYATTPNPGEIGNVTIVGHSSNNILNSGKYKFAFVLLKRLEADDTFFLQKDGVRYTYRVYKKDIVGPNDTSVLDTQEKPNTVTLITCDPPGTSINRLIVVAEQISPDPAGNKASTALDLDTSELEELPSNAPSLWSRLWPF
ncbi:sortase [Candidatus Saccharibacteria bacterium]|nr:sortase [Candidatus Saccharibacteria bacterium]